MWLNPGHGLRLTGLAEAFTLTWATTWGTEANTYIGPVLDLPELPVVDWPDTGAGPDGTFWKIPHLVAHAAGLPFAWVDDNITDADRDYVAAHHPAPALLRFVDPRLGLEDADFDALAAFGTAHRTTATTAGTS